MYRNEITINASKPVLLILLSNPFLVTGVMGHIGIIKVKDKKKGYVIPEYLEEPEKKYGVVFVTGDEKYNIIEGYAYGPEITPSSIKYHGSSKELEIEVDFLLTPISDNKTRVSIGVNASYKTSLIAKLVGREPFKFAEHIVEGHFIPFFKYFFTVPREMAIQKFEIEREEGDANSVISKFKEIVPKLDAGVIKLTGDNFTCKAIVLNGNIKRISCTSGNETKAGSDALSLLLLYSGSLKMSVTQINVEDLLEKV